MKTVIAAGTRTGLKMTRRGVASIRQMTVPVKVSPESPRRMAPKVAAVRNLTVRRESGMDSWSFWVIGLCWCCWSDMVATKMKCYDLGSVRLKRSAVKVTTWEDLEAFKGEGRVHVAWDTVTRWLALLGCGAWWFGLRALVDGCMAPRAIACDTLCTG